MRAKDHPEYNQERQHLEQTVQFAQEEVETWESYDDVLLLKSIHDAQARDRIKRIKKYKQVLKEPYFGRVDWHELESQSRDTFYIGKTAVPEKYIYSWRDNMVADLYYEGRTGREDGKLLLKRVFDIREHKLLAITDEFVDQSLTERLVAERFTDTLLVRLLQESRGHQLQDIVATIQGRQYEIITSPKDQLLVVQGAPGSGKSSIALHRVAYLLYHHRDDLDFSANRVLVLGPNPMFMKYVSNVLPALGERRVRQDTFDSWLVDRLETSVQYEPQETSLELLLNADTPASEKAMRYRNAKNKGSLKMARMLERYVDILHQDLLTDKGDFDCRLYSLPGERVTVTICSEDLRSMLDSLRDTPFNERVGKLQERVVKSVTSQAVPDTDRNLEDRIREEAKNQFMEYFGDWRSQNVSVAYRRLLRTPSLLHEAGRGIFSRWDLELLAHDAPTAVKPFRFSDLAAMLYLKRLLDGDDGRRYDHIVIDEAQDITPLHFKVLYEMSRDGSMTILGDLVQSIYPYHGLEAWEDLEQAAGADQLAIMREQQSYRSTFEIMECANSVLRRMGVADDLLAEPISRRGPEPTRQSLDVYADLLNRIIDLVHQEKTEGRPSIAIVCKTLHRCRTMADDLEKAGLAGHQLIDDRDATYEGDVVILPSYMTKGLEFDSVILPDADSDTYRPSKLNARLLTVVITRASHSLHILWVGSLTPLLDREVISVDIHAPLGGALKPRRVTIENFAAKTNDVEADWCVERLAGSGKLGLMRSGEIDETVLRVMVRSYKQSGSTSDQNVVEPLEKERARALEQAATHMEEDLSTSASKVLAFTQLAYGLLRNTIRRYGLEASLEGDDTFGQQVVLLWTLLDAVRKGEVTLEVGRRTTRRRVLDTVDESHREIAREQLSVLVEYGILEEGTGPPWAWIRVNQEWLQGLLELSLGYVPGEWDEDLLVQIEYLTQPIEPELVEVE